MNPNKEKYEKAVAEVTVFNERDVVGTILDDDRYPEGGGLKRHQQSDLLYQRFLKTLENWGIRIRNPDIRMQNVGYSSIFVNP